MLGLVAVTKLFGVAVVAGLICAALIFTVIFVMAAGRMGDSE